MILSRLRLAVFLFTSTMTFAADHVVTDYGATGDGVTLTTTTLQATIDAAHAAGGGRVVVPAGTFRSGSLFLRANVELHVAAGAVLLGSDRLEDYPKRNTRIEGHFEPWRLALINGSHLDGVRLTGPGRLDGNGLVFWEAFWQRRRENRDCTNLEVERPRLVYLDQCTDVEVRDLEFKDSGFWNLHLYNCQDVLVQGVSFAAPGHDSPVAAPSSDGIDIDSCQNVVIRDCTFDVNDDCIALKGSKGPLADQDAASPPVENVLIEDCTFISGHGVLTCGSEATIVRNITLRRSTVRGSINLVRLKLRPDTPQHYSNITYEDITLEGEGRFFDINPWLQFFDLKGETPPSRRVNNIVLRRISGHYGTPGRIVGNEGDDLAPFVMEDVNVTFTDPTFKRGDNVRFEIENSSFNGVPVPETIAPASSTE